MCAAKTRADVLEDLRIELAGYVKFRSRRGMPITYQQALTSHRSAIEAAFRDDGDEMWRDRLSLLDELCSEEGL